LSVVMTVRMPASSARRSPRARRRAAPRLDLDDVLLAGRARRDSPGCRGREVAVGVAQPRSLRGREQQPVERARASRHRLEAVPPRSSGGISTDTSRPASTLVRNGSGHPPGRSPSSPAMKPTTESGMS
jgi:hypothetical protein